MQAIDTLRDEHNGVLEVLHHLEQAANAAERGGAVPSDVFDDILEFFNIFVDRCHHGKEEAVVFPRLARRGHSSLLDRLETDHVEGRELAAAYAAAVEVYRPGDSDTGTQLAAAARAYADFLRRHIDVETRELFPAMEALADEDKTLVAEFQKMEEEQIGAGTHERLHAMIAGLPARMQAWTVARS